MSKEQDPHLFPEPQLFHLDGERAGMVMHSLGYVDLGPEAGQGVETSYHVTYFPGKANLYTRRKSADPSLPERTLIPGGTVPTVGHMVSYEYDGNYHGIWLQGYAAGELLDTQFVFADQPPAINTERKGFMSFMKRVDAMFSKFVSVESGMSVEDRRKRFQSALQRMNHMVRQRAIEDFGQRDQGQDFPKAA